tara:strand:- start:1805 stop:2059 length:255 start_codon:yes stop_codon:yes gene_type:complete
MVFISESYTINGKRGEIWILVAENYRGTEPNLMRWGSDTFPIDERMEVFEDLCARAFNRLGWVKDKRRRCGWRFTEASNAAKTP